MADQTPSAWRQTIRGRVLVAAVLFAVWVVAIEGRLVYLQVIKHDEIQAKADSQRLRVIPVPAMRGEIVDRGGRVLARSVDGSGIYAVPAAVKDVAATLRVLCDAFGDCTPSDRAEIGERLRRRGKSFVWVRHANRVSPDAAAKVLALALPGIGFMHEPQRFYPNGRLASHLLGYVGLENTGLSGVEAAYNAELSGKAGSAMIQVDARQHPFASFEKPATPGPTLQLTIDQYLQFVAEQELQAAIAQNKAVGGSVVIMEPRTGEIIALANAPSFNPNAFGDYSDDEKRNRAVQDVYEPGSTFKVVTASAALEEHVMSPDDPIDVSAGQIRIGSRKPISDTHRYGVLTFTDVIVKSSNVGAIKIGQRLGGERLRQYVQRFGFGTRLSPDFRGENAGLITPAEYWNDSVLASVSMGYQVGVTPLQMATAVSAVANGGELVQPRLVKATIAADGRRADVTPRVVRRAIAQTTADLLTTIMEGVVERGTATEAKIPGYTIAGKTGTAQKIEDGHYSKSNYYASFVGFIPSRNPVLTILVMIDSPHGHGYYGGTVSAPVFKRIAEKAIQHLGVPPNVDAPSPLLVVRHDPLPPVRTAPVRAEASRLGAAAAAAPSGAPSDGVPDVIGLSAREAVRVLARVGMTARMTGDGVVVQQEPRAGSPLERGAACSLALGRVASSVPVVSDQRQ